MQHAHVKCKEHSMNRYAIEEFYRIPELRGWADRTSTQRRTP
jgi:hypothetical protein